MSEGYQIFIEYFDQWPLLIKLVWVFGSILFVVILLLIFFLKRLRSRLRSDEKRREKYQKEFETDLITYLYSGNEEEKISEEQRSIINQIKNKITDKFKRRVIISVLLKLKNEISGEMSDSIQELYIETGLVEFSKSKLKHKRWFIIAIGIRELTQFQIKEVHDEIIKHLNHPNLEVRREVQLYLVYLFRFEGLDFLNNLMTPLSEWDQIKLLEILQKFDDQQIPDITKWLKSTDYSVVNFALKLTKIYNLFEMKDILLELIVHGNTKVRIQAIEILGYFQVIEAKEVLINNYYKYDKDTKIAIFQFLENTFENNDESFILEHIKDSNFEVKTRALKILKSIDKEKLQSIFESTEESEYNNIVKFIINN